MKRKDLWQTVKEVLFREWDPIGYCWQTPWSHYEPRRGGGN